MKFEEINMILKNKCIKLALGALLASSLAACGSSENDEKSNNAISTDTPQNANISGSFKSAFDTGVFYSINNNHLHEQFGRNGRHCSQQYNSYYYETENTLVFGNPDLPDSDFKQVAAWTENQFYSALTAMKITKDDYFQNRYKVRLQGLKHLSHFLSFKYYDSIDYPNGFDAWNDEQKTDWATKTVKTMATDEAVELLINDPSSPYTSKEEAIFQDKLYVCLTEDASPYNWGAGNSVGIAVAAPSIYMPGEPEKLVKHELVHTIQFALAGGFQGLGLPRWFAEGQAVLLSGMKVAKKSEHHHYDPTLVVYVYDEVGEQSTAYNHYGLAYQYLKDANGQTTINGMMKSMKLITYDFAKQNGSELEEYHGYVESFNATMKQLNGSPLTVEEYRYDYHSIMSGY